MFVFGEAVPAFWQFYVGAGAKGRFTIADWLGIDSGLAVLGIVVVAVVCFFVVERVEKHFTARHLEAQE